MSHKGTMGPKWHYLRTRLLYGLYQQSQSLLHTYYKTTFSHYSEVDVRYIRYSWVNEQTNGSYQ